VQPHWHLNLELVRLQPAEEKSSNRLVASFELCMVAKHGKMPQVSIELGP
jgi:hypothetical protein